MAAAANSAIQVDRDEKGVWFITGPDDAPLRDVFKAMGHSVATDRLWQMEIFRRTGTGRLAEVFGQDLLESDIWMRTVGYSGKYVETRMSISHLITVADTTFSLFSRFRADRRIQ